MQTKVFYLTSIGRENFESFIYTRHITHVISLNLHKTTLLHFKVRKLVIVMMVNYPRSKPTIVLLTLILLRTLFKSTMFYHKNFIKGRTFQ